MSDLPDFGRLSLGSPSQDTFQNQTPRSLVRHAEAPLSARSSSSHQGSYQQPQGHFSRPVATAFPRPENMTTPSRNVISAPRTPDPAAMRGGAFAGMAFNSALPRTPQNVGQGSMAFSNTLPRTPQNAGPGPMPFSNTPSRTPQNVGQGSMFFNNTLPRTPQNIGPSSTAFSNTLSHIPQGVGLGSMGLEQMEGAAQDHGFTHKLDKLFNMIERYSYTHLNFPSSAKDSQLHPSIKERLMKAASRESAHQLGSTGSTRYFLMTKVILQWMLKHVFTPTLFTSFDFDADHRIAGCKDHIFQDTPPLVKYQLLCEISKEIRQIREHPNFPVFLDTSVRNQGNKLWAILRPLMHQTTAMDWEDLRILMFEAYSVAGDMAAGPYEWRFDFANIGSMYNTSMLNRDPYVHGHEEEIINRGLVVRLGFIPAVFLRDNTDGMVRTEQVTRQQVLLKS